MDICFLSQTDITRVNYDQLAASLDGLTDLHADYRMCFLRIGTNQHDQVCILCDILNWVCHGT